MVRAPLHPRQWCRVRRCDVPWFPQDDSSSYWEDGKSRHTETNSELDECTFRPKIRPLPASYGSQKALEAVPFHQRVSQWQKHKEEEITKKREKEDDAEVWFARCYGGYRVTKVLFSCSG